MASKNLRLDVLHAQGDITVTNSDALNSSYNTIADVFDSNNTDTSMIVLESDENPAHTLITINNNQPKLANRIVISVGVALTGRVIINEGQTDQLILNWDTGRTSFNVSPKTLTLNFPGEISSVSSIKILYETFDESHTDHQNDVRLYGVQLFGKILYYAEFNDAVLDTTAWNSSRYDGKQLSATTINEFNTGDISYGGAPVMRNNTRTFYLASDIIPLDPDENDSLTDPTLPFIRDFSFAIINEAITINSDDTITSFNISNINTPSELTGFQRYFQQNIPIKSEINLIPLDAAITNKTQNQYSVFYNEGLLRGIIDFVHGDFSNESVSTGGQDFLYTTASADGRHPQFRVRGPSLPSGDNSGGVTIVKDTKFMRSVIGVNTPFSVFEGSAGGVALNAFFADALTAADNDPSQTKFYLSFATTSSLSSSLSKNGEEVQLEVINKNSDGRESTLGGLSTVKLISDGPDFGAVSFIGGIGEISCSKFDFEESNINYSIPSRLATEGLPAIIPGCHGYTFSKLDNNKPALLINLNRRELPEGIGNKPVIIVPQNLHPFIKDNLTYFSAQAGLDIGDRRIVPELNETNRNLP